MRESDRVLKRGGSSWHRHDQPHRRSFLPAVRTNWGEQDSDEEDWQDVRRRRRKVHGQDCSDWDEQ